jgi:hypothetical protein
MERIEGTLKTLGPSTTTLSAVAMTTYSYIEIGDRVLKKIRAFQGMTGPLQEGLSTPDPVTLYIEDNLLCGVQLPSGKIYASEMVSEAYLYVVIAAAALLGLITLPFLGLGLVFFYFGWQFWKLLSAKKAASAIPGAVMI